MSRPSALWRGILWVERFLPTPPTPPAEPSLAAKRKAVVVTQFVLLAVLLANLSRHRHELGDLIAQDRAVFAQLTLLIAACVVVAAIAFGVKAWRDAMVIR